MKQSLNASRSIGAVLAISALLYGVLVVMLLGVASMGANACTTDTAATGGKARGVPTELIPIYQRAAAKYKLGKRGPTILAAINRIETNFGRDLSSSYAGAMGWMQFMPGTWASYGVDGNGDGVKDPHNKHDAIHAAARYLRASGAPRDWYKAIFAYNHADWYVQDVLTYAKKFAVPASPAGVISGGECEESIAPNDAVNRMYEEAARIHALRLPYVWGGSHGLNPIPKSARAFDCSSAVSRLLQVGGTKAPTMTTLGLLGWGRDGPGKWITIHVNAGHTFLEFRFAPPKHRYWGTSGMRPDGFTGPGWIHKSYFGTSYLATFQERHPAGL